MSRVAKVRVAGYEAGITLSPSTNRNAPTIVALHGFTGCAQDFQPVRDCLGPSAANWICPDFMGHGASDAPSVLDPYLLPATLRLISLARAQAPDPDRVLLLAYSMGGRLALHYLLQASPIPAVLIGASPGLPGARERDNRRRADQKWIQMISGKGGIEGFAEAWERQSLIAPQKRLPQPLCDELAHRRRSNRRTGLIQSILAVGTGALPSLWQQLDRISSLRLVFGLADRKFGQVASDMAMINPHFQLVEIPGAGHSPHLEQPARLARLLEQELQALSAS